MSREQDSAAVEAEIRSAFDRGDLDEAATLPIQRYGGEILGFLVARIGSRDEASEVFSLFRAGGRCQRGGGNRLP